MPDLKKGERRKEKVMKDRMSVHDMLYVYCCMLHVHSFLLAWRVL
jgi:hypothetical protein